MIKVLIADDHTVLRQGLRLILNEADALTVVGEAANGAQAVQLAAELQPDVVLMDVNMPQMDGIEATRRLRAQQPHIKVIMLNISKKESDLIEAIKAGAKGYFLKCAESAEVVDSIRRVAAGQAIMPPHLMARVLEELANPEPAPDQLTARELDTLNLVARGLGNREIAATLHISENTVKTHVRHILEKLHLSNRAEAAAYAVKNGLTTPE